MMANNENETGGNDMSAGALPTDLRRLKEASEHTGVPVRTLREWARSGRIAKYKQGGYAVLVSLEDIRRVQRIERVE